MVKKRKINIRLLSNSPPSLKETQAIIASKQQLHKRSKSGKSSTSLKSKLEQFAYNPNAPCNSDKYEDEKWGTGKTPSKNT